MICERNSKQAQQQEANRDIPPFTNKNSQAALQLGIGTIEDCKGIENLFGDL